MLMYGPSRCLQYIDKDSFKVYNFTGMLEGFDSIQNLIPPIELGKVDSYEFDINYYNYIFNNDNIFIIFFRIIQSIYIGNPVYIISDESYWSEALVESLLKIIQQRYGYNAYFVNTEEDIIYALQRDDLKFNPIYGLQNLDIDKNRYQYIVKNIEMSYGNSNQKQSVTNFYIG